MGEKNINLDKLVEEAKQGRLEDFLSKNLSAETKAKLSSILSDKSKTDKMLASPQAKEIMKKLNKDK